MISRALLKHVTVEVVVEILSRLAPGEAFEQPLVQICGRHVGIEWGSVGSAA
jgi:hypothetical protein